MTTEPSAGNASGLNLVQHRGCSVGTTPEATEISCQCGWTTSLPGYDTLGIEASCMAEVAAVLLSHHRHIAFGQYDSKEPT